MAMRGGTTYAYDGNGNIISADTDSYQYDSQNRLTEALVNGQAVGTYSYDAMSHRVKKIAYGVITYFVYDQFSNLIAESDASGNITREYIYLNGQPLALIDLPLPSSAPPQTISQQVSMGCSSIFVWDPKGGILGYVFILSPFFFLVFFQVTRNWKKSGALLLVVLGVSFAVSLVVVHRAKAQDTGEKIYYYHNDHLGSPIKLTDANQNTVWSWQYGPFGEEPLTMNSNTISQNLRFPGQYYDSETGLHYNFHRYYSPKLGRYLTTDPIGIYGGINLFIYGANNPIKYFDPFGLTTLTLNVGSCSLTVDPEDGSKSTYNICATSGSGSCKNESKCEQKKDEGPLPRGKYNVNANDISNPGRFGDILRNLTGDWGDWRVPINPSPGTETYGRSGFFLHGGRKPGTSGCIDIGGGIFGDANTDRLLKDLINDPDKKIPLTVK